MEQRLFEISIISFLVIFSLLIFVFIWNRKAYLEVKQRYIFLNRTKKVKFINSKENKKLNKFIIKSLQYLEDENFLSQKDYKKLSTAELIKYLSNNNYYLGVYITSHKDDVYLYLRQEITCRQYNFEIKTYDDFVWLEKEFKDL